MNFHEEAKCSACKYFCAVFKPAEKEGDKPKLMGGQCRRQAPLAQAIVFMRPVASIESGGVEMQPAIERVTVVPHVMPDFWCGQFELYVAGHSH